MTDPPKDQDTDVVSVAQDEHGDEITISSDDPSWIRHEPGARARKKHTSATEETNDNERFELANLRYFYKFQQRIFHLVHSIVHKPQNKTNKFCTTWIKAERHPSLIFDEKSTFRTVQKLFKEVKSLQDYCRLVNSCPGIGQYFTTRILSDEPSQFEYKFRLKSMSTVLATAKPNPEIITKGEETTHHDMTYADVATGRTKEKLPKLEVATDPIDSESYSTCLGTKTVFINLMSQVYLIMSSYSTALPNEDVSQLWLKWQDQGLKAHSDFQEFKRITSIDSLDQFYLYLQDCPPVTTVLDLKWDNKILYRTALLNSPAASLSTSDLTTSVNTDMSELKPPANNITNQTAPAPDIQKTNTTVVSQNPIAEHPDSISGESFVDVDHDTFKSTSYHIIDLRSIQTSPQFTVFHALMYDTILAWTLDTSAKHHPYQNEWQRARYHGMDRYKTFQELCQILKLHTLLEYVEFMSKCPAIKQTYDWQWTPTEFHYWYLDIPFHVDLNKVENLRHELTAFEVEFTSNLKDLHNQMKDANFRMEALEHRISKQANTIEGKFKQYIASHTESIKPILQNHILEAEAKLKNVSETLVNNFQLGLKSDLFTQEATLLEHTTKFRDSISTMFTKTIETAQTHLSEIKNQLTEHANTIQAAFQEKAEEATTQFRQLSSETIAEIQRNVHQPTDPYPTNLKVDTSVHPTVNNVDIRSPTAEPSFMSPTDVNPITGLAHQPSTMPKDDANTPSIKVAARWTNVDPAFVQRLETPANLRQPTYPPNTSWGKAEENTTIPPLQYDNIMKRLSVQYTGQRDLLVFYHQLMNGLNPYGCYLKKLADVKVDETLCPDYWEHIKISDNRYLQMAGCLYQKLASIDVIPLEFTYARNIINRFAEINDGYKVLYAMIAPLLTRDTISTVPSMKDCADIHSYSLKTNRISIVKC